MSNLIVMPSARAITKAKILVRPTKIAHSEQTAGTQGIGQAGTTRFVQSFSMCSQIVADRGQAAPAIIALAASDGIFQRGDVAGRHWAFGRAAKMGRSVSLLALLHIETSACLQQPDEIAGAVAARIEIAVIGAQIDDDARD